MHSLATTRFYIWWLVGYYVWVFIALGRYIEMKGLYSENELALSYYYVAAGYQTLYDRVTQKNQLKWLANLNTHHLIKKLVYIMIHFGFGLFTMSVATICWHSYTANLAFILAVCTSVSWNASSFYFKVFPRKQVESANLPAEAKASRKNN